ncbi:hypothetical protein PENSPDRAFT_671584 [Peniophora sp. CONT]|nr:hypothetical protein PENSPDRAFT_671584 [Peniophora sp. CONT]
MTARIISTDTILAAIPTTIAATNGVRGDACVEDASVDSDDEDMPELESVEYDSEEEKASNTGVDFTGGKTKKGNGGLHGRLGTDGRQDGQGVAKVIVRQPSQSRQPVMKSGASTKPVSPAQDLTGDENVSPDSPVLSNATKFLNHATVIDKDKSNVCNLPNRCDGETCEREWARHVVERRDEGGEAVLRAKL